GRMIAEASKITEVALSPDGEWVAYTIARGSVRENRYQITLWLQRIEDDAQALPAPRRLAEYSAQDPKQYGGGSFTPRWRSDSRKLAFFAPGPGSEAEPVLVAFDPASGATAPIRIACSVSKESAGIRPPRIGTDYRWSQSGKRIAFTAAVGAG